MSVRNARTRLFAAVAVVLAALVLTGCKDGTGVRDEGPATAHAPAAPHAMAAPAPVPAPVLAGQDVTDTARPPGR
jgi:hypothetical protein